jgi:phosphopantetheine adenylyltransferase
MIEYTRELLNSNCDLDFINCIVERAVKIIAKKVLENNKEGKKKLLYDLTTESDFRGIFKNLRLKYQFDYELSWKFALEIIVTEFKKVFTDSNIYYENKEVKDVYDNISVHRLIIIDWS